MFVRSLLAALAFVLSCAMSLAQPGGTVAIVDRFGNHLDGNSFTRIDAVYFTGGKGANCSAPGLADGDYYFQITDPAGTVLLTPDPLPQRLVHASGGNLTAYLGRARPAAFLGPCGALHVRLAPFAVTPYPSGEYKLWLTRVQDYDPLGSNLFGFDPALSKSDNFRVHVKSPQTILRGHKFYDHDRSGTWNPQSDALEVPVGGWRVEIWRNGVLDGLTFTDQDGWYVFLRDRDASTYDLREISPNGFVNDNTPGATWLATTPRTGTAATTAEYVAGPEFGNVNYQLVPLAGRNVTFWSNRPNTPPSGYPILQAFDPLWRVALNTRNGHPVNLRNPVSNDNPNASIFDLNMPPQSFSGAFANWKAYADKTPHDHAGYLLSRQVGATLLNITVGYMQGSIFVDRFNDGVLVSLDVMLDGAIGLLSQTGAGLTGPGDAYQDLRHMMQMCTNEFGRINETGDASAPQVVYRSGDSPPPIVTPY